MKSRWPGIFLVLALAVVSLTANVALARPPVTSTVRCRLGAPAPRRVRHDRVERCGTPARPSRTAGHSTSSAPSGTYTMQRALGLHEGRSATSSLSISAVASVPMQLSVSVKEGSWSRVAPVIDTAKTTIGVSERRANQGSARAQLRPSPRRMPSTAPATRAASRSGATGLENQYIIDGVNTTDKIGAQKGKTLTNRFVQESKSRPAATSRVRSRARRHDQRRDEVGRQRVPWRPLRVLRQRNLASNDDRRRPHGRRPEPGHRPRATTSAPTRQLLPKDRLWFFGAVNRSSATQDYTRNAGIFYSPGGTLNTSQGTGISRRQRHGRRRRRLLRQADVPPRQAHTLSASVFGGPGVQRPPGLRSAPTRPSGRRRRAARTSPSTTASSARRSSSRRILAPRGEEREPLACPTLSQIQNRGGPTQSSAAGCLRRRDYKRDDFKAWARSSSARTRSRSAASESSARPSPKYPSGARFAVLGGGGACLYNYQRYFAKVPLNCIAPTTRPASTRRAASAPGERRGAAPRRLRSPVGGQPPTTKILAIFAQDSWKILRLHREPRRPLREQRLSAPPAPAIAITGSGRPHRTHLGSMNGSLEVYASYGRYYSTIPRTSRPARSAAVHGVRVQHTRTRSPITDFGYWVPDHSGRRAHERT